MSRLSPNPTTSSENTANNSYAGSREHEWNYFYVDQRKVGYVARENVIFDDTDVAFVCD